MKVLFFLSLLVIAFASKHISSINYTLCSESTIASLDLSKCTFSPNPPVGGQSFTFHAEGTMSKADQFMEICVDTNAGPIPINICKDLPLQPSFDAGAFTYDYTMQSFPDIPWYVPKGTYTGTGKLRDADEADLICLDVTAVIEKDDSEDPFVHFDEVDFCTTFTEQLSTNVIKLFDSAFNNDDDYMQIVWAALDILTNIIMVAWHCS